MTTDSLGRQRHTISIHQYGPSKPGTYLVTTNSYQRKRLFGEVVDGKMKYNPLGLIVRRAWLDLPRRYPHVALDAFCVMPDLFQGVIILISELGGSDVAGSVSIPSQGLPEILGIYKSLSSRQINAFRKTPGMPTWQRGYYKRVLRDQAELDLVREAIENKPRNWRLEKNDLLKMRAGENA
jgi:putative transposase